MISIGSSYTPIGSVRQLLVFCPFGRVVFLFAYGVAFFCLPTALGFPCVLIGLLAFAPCGFLPLVVLVVCLPTALAFPCVLIGLLASPLCGANANKPKRREKNQRRRQTEKTNTKRQKP
jgi:hypothetical protein